MPGDCIAQFSRLSRAGFHIPLMMYRIPFNLLPLDPVSYHPLIDAKVNEIPCKLIIDTGASRSVFDLEAFDIPLKTGLGDDELIPAGIVEGKIGNKTGVISSLELGSFRKENMEAIFIDLGHINRLYQQVPDAPDVAGLIGSDFLVSHQAVIDYQNKVLILSD